MLKILSLLICLTAGNLYCQYSNDDNNRYLLGESYEQSGMTDKAREIFEDLNKRNPGNLQYFISLNRVYVSLKQYEASRRILEQRLTVSPLDINIYGMLGATYYLMGDETKAFSVWEDGLKKVPVNQLNYRDNGKFCN